MANAQILVVEDEKIVAENIRDRLKSLGYAVAVAYSGEEAIQKTTEMRPDLVLIDIVLKGDIDGVEAAERICDSFDIPVVYLTAYADEDILQRAKVTEPFGYILKPFKERELHTIIEMALYKHEMGSKLKESERWLSTILKSIGDAVIATDTEGVIRFMNPVAEALTGWEQGEALGEDLTEIFNIIEGEALIPTESPVTKALREGIIVSLADRSIVFIAKDGTETSIEANAAPIKDDEGNITGVVLVFLDITERKQAEREIRKLSSAVKQSIDGIAIGDLELKLAYVNDAFARMHDYSREEMIGMKVVNLYNEEQMDEYKRSINQIKTQGSWIGEIDHIRKDGTPFPTYTSATLLRDERGKATGILGVCRDITEHKRMGEERQRLERLATLGEMLAILVHEVRNPVANIFTGLQYLVRNVDKDSKSGKVIKIILDEVDRINRIIGDVLFVARPKKLLLTLCSIPRIIEESVQSHRAEASKVVIDISCEESLPQIEVNERHIERALSDLISNAIEAMPTGGRLSIHAGLKDNYIEIKITDTGCGIPSSQREKIFEPFFTTRAKGIGLGLAIVSRIIEEHSGVISVDSEVGRGTTFTILLPTVLSSPKRG